WWDGSSTRSSPALQTAPAATRASSAWARARVMPHRWSISSSSIVQKHRPAARRGKTRRSPRGRPGARPRPHPVARRRRRRPPPPPSLSGRVAVWLTAACGIMLAAAFLFFHRLDLARAIDAWRALAAFVHARGLARGRALAESAAALVVAALVVLAWYGAGAGLLRIVHRRWPSARPHVVATACAIGALVWSLVWFVLGLAGAYRTAPALVALAIGVSLAVAATTRRSARGAVAEVTPSLAIDTSVIASAAM